MSIVICYDEDADRLLPLLDVSARKLDVLILYWLSW